MSGDADSPPGETDVPGPADESRRRPGDGDGPTAGDGAPGTGDDGPATAADRGWIADTIARRRRPTTSLYRYRHAFVASTVLFVAFAALGFYAGPDVIDDPATVTPLTSGKTAVGYFLQNVTVALALMGGMGVLTLLFLFNNGFNFGVALWILSAQGRLEEAVVGIAPHGVVEIPALLVAGGIGLLLPYRVLSYLFGDREVIATREDEIHLAGLFVLVVLGIAVAAVIESAVTARLIGRASTVATGPLG